MKRIFLICLFFLGMAAPAHAASDNFESIIQHASGSAVTLCMWGGSSAANAYVDDFVIPRVKQDFNITLRRVPIDDPRTILRKVDMEKNAGRAGQADILWLNGKNFSVAKRQKLLYGPFVDQLPSVQKYIDLSNPANNTDFTEKIDGLEAPWGKSQFILIYDSARVKNPPTTVEDLYAWIQKHPGRFTYPRLPDFTGSAFVRTLWVQRMGDEANTKAVIEKKNFAFWNELRDVTPFLYQQGFFPANSAMLDILFSRKEVDFTFSYNPSHALNKISSKMFPSSTRITVFDNTSLVNVHFLSIPITAPNKKGAMVVINYLLSPEAQLKKQDPAVWGDRTVLDMRTLPPTLQAQFATMEKHPALPNAKKLADHAKNEMSAECIESIEQIWQKHVLQ